MGEKSETLIITFKVLPDGETMSEKGRCAWALRELVKAGDKGCIPIANPAPRWSSYVHRIRQRGIVIETIHESHKGDFPGHHAKYVVRTPLAIISDSSKPEAEGIAA